jgi:hypothetical protein
MNDHVNSEQAEIPEVQESSDRYTVTFVPGAKICLEVTVPLPSGPQPNEPISLERRAQILRRIKAEIPALIPALFHQHSQQLGHPNDRADDRRFARFVSHNPLYTLCD